MKRFEKFLFGCFLLLSIASKAQYLGLVNGTATTTGVQTGSTINTVNNSANSFQLTTTTTGAPTSISIQIQGSTNNGTTYSICGGADTAIEATQIQCSGSYDHVQVNVTTLTGGTAPTIVWSLAASGGITNLPLLPTGDTPTQSQAKRIFGDTFVGAAIDTNTWNTPTSAGGGVTCTVASNAGQITCGSGTTANGYSYITTQGIFNQVSPGFLSSMDAMNFESPVTANAYRAWGFCTPQAVPTAANPIIDGLVFEMTTTGKLQVVGYANGAGRQFIADLSSTGNNKQPLDSAVHKYFIDYRGDLSYFYIDYHTPAGLVATMPTGAPGPINNNLQKCLITVAGAVAPSSSAVISDNASWLGDSTGRNETLCDYNFGWRCATVSAGGSVSVNTTGTSTTYRTSTNWSPTGTAATDIFTITGSATKVVRVNHIGISCTATAAIATDIIIQLRSTADTGGSASTAPLNRLDPNDAAPTATVLAYTANPTPGTLVGPISDDKASITTTTGAPQFYFEDFGIRNGKPVVLRGTGSVLAISLNGASITGIGCAAEVELTEDVN